MVGPVTKDTKAEVMVGPVTKDTKAADILPWMELQVGRSVRIQGLKNASHLNGLHGLAAFQSEKENGRWGVELIYKPDYELEYKLVKAENLVVIAQEYAASPGEPITSLEKGLLLDQIRNTEIGDLYVCRMSAQSLFLTAYKNAPENFGTRLHGCKRRWPDDENNKRPIPSEVVKMVHQYNSFSK